jgi:hypothetical protein
VKGEERRGLMLVEQEAYIGGAVRRTECGEPKLVLNREVE